jgi:antitoxin (DNA-binding transcriptional repressor) of toxin-antitoxin stability system
VPNFVVASAAAVVLALFFACAAIADALSPDEVRAAMADVEGLLERQGVDVAGYATDEPPPAERVRADDPMLRGNDGAYVAGRIYLNADGIEECMDLVLRHELVHDASVRRRLFTKVTNADLRDAFEALADAVTAVAAQEPFRPGCLPHRRFDIDMASLSAMASPVEAAPAPSAVPPPLVVPVFFSGRRMRLSREARKLLSELVAQVEGGRAATIVVADLGETTSGSIVLANRRAAALGRFLRGASSRSLAVEDIRTGEQVVLTVARKPAAQAFHASPGIGKGPLAP